MSVLTISSSGPMARAAGRFVQNRAAMFGFLLLVPLLLAVLTYPLWLPYKPNDIDLLAERLLGINYPAVLAWSMALEASKAASDLRAVLPDLGMVTIEEW